MRGRGARAGSGAFDLDMPSKGETDGGEPENLPVSTTKTKRSVRGAKKQDVEEIKIPELKTKVVILTVKGDTPLICHRFSEKSKIQMANKQQGKAQHKKGPKVPHEEYLAALYPVPGTKNTYGFPASAFKLAAVSACRHVDGMTMTKTLGSFHVLGDILPILGSKPKMREDIVRLNSGPRPVADLRYRPEFTNWSVKLTIRYNSAVISPGQIANLLNVAGFAVGVGEWRPEKKGAFGMFSVVGTKE